MELPISFGSSRLPTRTWTKPTSNRTRVNGNSSPNCIKQKHAGNKVPIREPTVGIKFNIKIRNAQKRGESIPIIASMIKLNNPVMKLTRVLSHRYLATDTSILSIKL